MAESSLTRVGSNTYTGMLLEKSDQPEWRTPTMLALFIDASGSECAFFLTSEAREQFQPLDRLRIYNIVIKGSCVKNNSSGLKYGVKGKYEVKLMHKTQVHLATHAWPVTLNLDVTDFASLNQSQSGTCVDIIGRLTHKTTPEAVGTSAEFMKSVFLLSDGTYEQEVELLGAHSTAEATVGDLVAVKGAVIKEWKGRRSVQTGYLTHVCTNPTDAEHDIPSVDEIRDHPKAKAIRLSPKNPVALNALHTMISKMQEDEKNGKPSPSWDVQFYAETTPLDESFFENGTPTIGEHPHQTYLWKTELKDSMATESVKIWNKAGLQLFGMSARNLQDEWEAGLQHETRREAILQKLNKNLGKKCLCLATLKLFKSRPDININGVELLEEA